MKNPLLILIVLILPSNATALQIIAAVDGKTLPVTLSLNALNRIAMADGSRINHLWGPQDRMVIESDTDSGQLFLRPVGSKPFSLFVKADNGETYTLLAAPKAVPAETIFLRPPYAKPQHSAERALPYTKRITELAKALARHALPEGYTPVANPTVVPLWQTVHLTRQVVYHGGRLAGEVYRITNLSPNTLTLAEQQFKALPGSQKSGQESTIIAIAIDQHQLPPQASTGVYIIRQAGRP